MRGGGRFISRFTVFFFLLFPVFQFFHLPADALFFFGDLFREQALFFGFHFLPYRFGLFFVCLVFVDRPYRLFYGAVGFGNDFLCFGLSFADDLFAEPGGFVQFGTVFFYYFIQPFFILMDFAAFFFPIAFVAGNVFQVTVVVDVVFSDLRSGIVENLFGKPDLFGDLESKGRTGFSNAQFE